jgi:TATA-binding protein-associated factor Taf7
MILSVPEEIGIMLQRIIQGNATVEEKNSTNIQIIENASDSIDIDESRKLIFKFNDMLLPVTVLDFPTTIEAKKTIDYKTFYKSSDISQMMFVHDKEYQLGEEEELKDFDPFLSKDPIFNKMTWKKDPDHKYKLKNGLSKSTRNIRARRFKSKHKYNHEEMLEVAKKLKTIIDNGAASFENQLKREHGDFDNQSLIHSVDIASSVAPKNTPKKKEFVAPANKKKNISINISLNTQEVPIPVPQIQPINNSIIINTEPEDPLIIEYLQLKDEYKQLKQELKSFPNDDKKRLKKKIKKRMKEIKQIKKN